MAIYIEDLVIYHSGGAGNSNGQEDTGGAIGERFQSMNHALNSTAISGLSIIESFGFSNNAVITISYDSVSDSVTVSNGDSSFNENKVLSGVDEVITIKDINGTYVILDITYALITGSTTTSAEYTFTDNKQNLFDNTLPLESTNGYTDYRVIYAYNEAGTDAFNVTLFTEKPMGDDTVLIGTGTINTLITDTNDVTVDPLNDINAYTATSSYANGINIGTLPAGQYIPIILKRVVPAGVDNFSANQLEIIVAAD